MPLPHKVFISLVQVFGVYSTSTAAAVSLTTTSVLHSHGNANLFNDSHYHGIDDHTLLKSVQLQPNERSWHFELWWL